MLWKHEETYIGPHWNYMSSSRRGWRGGPGIRQWHLGVERLRCNVDHVRGRRSGRTLPLAIDQPEKNEGDGDGRTTTNDTAYDGPRMRIYTRRKS